MSKSSNTGEGIGLGMILFIVFLILKLTNVINWSWWWVTAPLWGSFAIAITISLIAAIAVWVYNLFKRDDD